MQCHSKKMQKKRSFRAAKQAKTKTKKQQPQQKKIIYVKKNT